MTAGSRPSVHVFVALAAAHGAAVLTLPSAALIAIGLWWNSNTIAHNFIHRPFFRSRLLNAVFSGCQSMLMGVPQVLWRDRHLAHHMGVDWRLRWSRQLLIEVALICTVWAALTATNPTFFFNVYLVGYVAGLTLCAVQGHYEHTGGTTSHYGRLYNLLCFNDGYHAEHHARPGVHWRALPRCPAPDARVSRWPALLRWVDDLSLDGLERLVLRSPRLQRFVLDAHRNAFRVLLRDLAPPHRIAVVGGGLFPRTAFVLRELLPAAQIVIIDSSRANLDTARPLLDDTVTLEHARFSAADHSRDVDLIVIPLAFSGDRGAVYRRPPAPLVMVHDWVWRRRGRGCVISAALLKRLNLVSQ
jgi:hypothetical protein